MARRGVVLVPEGRNIFVDMTVEENLRLGAYARRDDAAVEADVEDDGSASSRSSPPSGATRAAR